MLNGKWVVTSVLMCALTTDTVRAVSVTLEASNLGLTSFFSSRAASTTDVPSALDFEPLTSPLGVTNTSADRSPNTATGTLTLAPDLWTATTTLARGGAVATDGAPAASTTWRMVFRMNEAANITLGGTIAVNDAPRNNMSIGTALYDVTTVDDFTPGAAILLMIEGNAGSGTNNALALGSGAGQSSTYFYNTRTATLQADRRYFLEMTWQVAAANGLPDNGQPFSFGSGSATFSVVPEPTTLGVVGGAMMLLMRRRKAK
jgi:hypothetical protein